MRRLRMTLIFGCAVVLMVMLTAGSTSAAPQRAGATPVPTARQLDAVLALTGSRTRGARRRGYPVRPRAHSSIVGGTSVAQGSWGFMAFVVHYDDAGNPDFSCSGTLLSPTVVLTAAHCVIDDSSGEPNSPAGYLVVTGAVDLADTVHRQLSTVRTVSVEPNYDPSSFAGDAALLELTTPSSAPTVRIARANETGPYVPGTSALIAGWGMTYPGGYAPTLLRAAPTNVQGPGYCSQFSDWFRSDWETCAAQATYLTTGTCNGDSGGPLIAMDASQQPVEIGVTSVGPRDCNTQSADYFTRTDAIATWVRTLMSSVTVGPPATTTTTTATVTTTTTTSTPPPASKPIVTLPVLTMADARVYAATMVLARTHKRPKLSMSCGRVNTWTAQCSVSWRDGSVAYALSGRFFHYLQGKQVYWWYNFAGTRRWRTCRMQHARRLCTSHAQRFRWT